MPDQQPWLSPVELGVQGVAAWKMLAWQRSPLCMACGRPTVLVTPMQPADDGGWVVAGHLPGDGATVEPSPFPEVRHEHLLLCWRCVVAGGFEDRVAEAVELPLLCAAGDCDETPGPGRRFCESHWPMLPRAARDELAQAGQEWARARLLYLDGRGDWLAVTGLGRRVAELSARAAAGIAQQARARRARRRAEMVTIEAGSVVRALEDRRIQVKAGRPQEITRGMQGVVVHTVLIPASAGRHRQIAVEWTFPSGRRRTYPTDIGLLELVARPGEDVAAQPQPEAPAASPAGVAIGRGLTYEDAVASAVRELGADAREVDVVILEEDEAGSAVVRVTARARLAG